MTHEPVASRLWVLSDLHLAPPGEQCVFSAHEALTALIDHMAATPSLDPPQWLVLNGDVFDHLQIADYDALNLPLARDRTQQILDALDAEPPERNVVQALRRFTSRGHKLSCMPGNHDAELNLAPVQALLSARLGSTTELTPWAGEWRLDVAGHRVVGRHGHYADAFNAIGGTQMLRAQAAGDPAVPMPPGSRLVLQVINPFRRAKTADGTKRFPFIDSLPSEQAVLLAIMLLDPRLAGKRLPAALGIGAAALLRKALMASGRAQKLSHTGTQAPETPSLDGWRNALDAVLTDAAGNQSPESAAGIEYALDAYFAGASNTAGQSLSSEPGAVRGMLLRALARTLDGARTAFRSDAADDLAQDSMATWGQGQVALAGHTHAARCLTAADGTGTYINTGTWLDQVLVPAGLAPDTLLAWLERLREGQIPTWNGHPVAVVDREGPRLARWGGQALQPWSDPTEVPGA